MHFEFFSSKTNFKKFYEFRARWFKRRFSVLWKKSLPMLFKRHVHCKLPVQLPVAAFHDLSCSSFWGIPTVSMICRLADLDVYFSWYWMKHSLLSLKCHRKDFVSRIYIVALTATKAKNRPAKKGRTHRLGIRNFCLGTQSISRENLPVEVINTYYYRCDL